MPRNRLGIRGDKGEPQRTWRGAKGRKVLLRLAMTISISDTPFPGVLVEDA